MRKKMYEAVCDFEKIMYQIEDMKNIALIFQEYMYDNCTAGMGIMQSIVNTHLRLLERTEDECLALDEKLDKLLEECS